MKKLFSLNLFPLIVAPFIVFLFFLPNLVKGKLPIPADALLGLYHPWRDVSYGGFNAGKFPVKNPLITDPVLQTYSWRKIAIENLKEGELPLWNPYSFSGQPLFANLQSSPFQLFNVFFLIFPFKIAWGLQIILPFAFGAFFMSLFMKSLNLSDEAVIFGSIILPFSGFFVVWGEWGTVVASAIWLPLILYAVVHLFKNLNPFYFLLLVLAVSQSIFAGHIQTSIYVVLASILFIFLIFLKSKKIAPIVTCSFGVALGIAISAIQIMPTLEFVKLSARSLDQSYFQGRQDWFLPFKNLIQLFAPDFFGNPATYNYWGIWNYGEFVSFVGVVALIFAILGVFKQRNKITFFILLLILSLFLALENPLSKLPYTLNIPFISSMQPSRIIFLVIFSLSVISAFGFEAFLKSKEKNKFILMPAIIMALIFILAILQFFSVNIFGLITDESAKKIALRNLIIPALVTLILLITFSLKILKFPKIIIILAIFTVTIFELFRFTNKFLPFAKIELIFPETRTTTFLANQQRPFRVLATDRRIFGGNSLSAYGVETVQGYDPLFLKDYSRLVSSWNENKKVDAGNFNRIITPQNYQSPISNLLNVKYVASFDDISEKGFKKIYQEGETKIFVNENAFNRVFFVDEIIKVTDKDEELEKMFEESTNLENVAFSSEINFPKKESKNDGTFRFESYSDQELALKVNVLEEAPLVISNVYYPGWKAYISGIEVPIYRVDYLLQAIIVPKGESLIKFKFSPQSFYNGLYISLMTSLLAILVSLILWRKRFQ